MTNEQKYLIPAPDSASGPPASVERFAFYQAPPEQEQESSALPIAHYLWMLSRHKWRLLAFIAIAVASTIVISSRLTPYYQSTATIDVDRMAPNAVIGQESLAARATSANDSDIFLSTQVSLIKSDSVLRPVVQRLKIKTTTDKPGQLKDPLGDEAPIVLKYLTITRPPKTYLLQISYRDPDRAFAAEVANAIANSYIDRSYAIRFNDSGKQALFMNRQLEELQAKMERSAAALVQFEKELNVISPEEKTNILSARLLQLNTEWTNAQGDRMKKEAAAKSVRGGASEALEASAQGEQIRRLLEKIGEDSEKFAAARAQYGVNHPEYKKAAVRQAQLQQELENLKVSVGKRVDSEYREALDREKSTQEAVLETKREFDQLNSKSVLYKALKRDADADKALYDELTRKIKEAGINAGFQGSSIRLADPARPGRRPVFPRVQMNALLAFFVSAFLGIVVVFVSENMDHTLRDPDQ
ncbi:MAG: GNVR domain-containing protein, partial [Acidobacteriota bacterium]